MNHPSGDPNATTSALRARQLVREGKAQFDTHCRLVLNERLVQTTIGRELLQRSGYDGAVRRGKMATRREAQHVPICMYDRLLRGRRGIGPGEARRIKPKSRLDELDGDPQS